MSCSVGIVESMNSSCIFRARSWNYIWKCLLTQSSLFQSSFVQAEICSLLFFYQRKICIKLAHILPSSKVVHHGKRSVFILLHNLVLVNLMYCCSYFKHGIEWSYFRANNRCSGLGVSWRRLISIGCLSCDLWSPVLPGNTYGKNSPWILVSSEVFGVAARTRSVGVSGCLGSPSLGTD